jgi:type II secretion system (T2SS) protein E
MARSAAEKGVTKTGADDDQARVHAAEHPSVPTHDSTLDAAPRRWRLDTLQRSDVVFELRDFCRRVGLHAEVRSPTTVEILGDRPRAEVDVHLREWLRVTGVELRVTPLERAAARVEPRPAPLLAPPRIGELLIRKGFLTQEKLDWALAESRASKDLLGVVLLRSKLIYEDELARTLSEQLDIPYVSVMRIGIDQHVVRLIPAEAGEAAAAIPVRVLDSTVQVAFADPTDERALAVVSAHLPRITVGVAELSDIRLAWREVERAARGGSRLR